MKRAGRISIEPGHVFFMGAMAVVLGGCPGRVVRDRMLENRMAASETVMPRKGPRVSAREKTGASGLISSKEKEGARSGGRGEMVDKEGM